MAAIHALATYQPVWADEAGRRIVGFDEDVATLAVAAARVLVDTAQVAPDRVVLITRRPDMLLGTTGDVVLQGLNLAPQTPIEERLGGAPATLEALASADVGTLLVAVDPDAPAAAAAALIGEDGSSVEVTGVERFSVPVRVRPTGDTSELVYDDPRLLRERGWRRAVELLADPDLPVVVTGVSARDAAKIRPDAAFHPPAEEAAAPLLAIAEFLEGGTPGQVLALENGLGVAAAVTSGSTTVRRELRDPVEAPGSWEPRVAGEVPASIAAYERSFVSKVGFVGARCRCGALHYPPRRHCDVCGRADDTSPEPLPRRGTVYSAVTVRTPVPGKTVPYTLAVSDVGDGDVRVLTHVTDTPAGTVVIGDEGSFVLRRVAVRAGVPDYGIAFQPGGQS